MQKFLVPLESDEKFAENLEQIRNSGFVAYSCNGFLPETLKAVGTQTNHDEILAYAETAFRRAQQAGIKRIAFGSSGSRKIPDGFDESKAHEQFVELLKKLGPIASKYDVVVVIEPLNSKECNLVNTVAEATDIAKQVNHPNIQVLADFYHMMRENESPQSIINAGKMLQHCHIAEKEKRTYPGAEGDDFTPYFKALLQINYAGGISIEGGWGDSLRDNLPAALQTMKTQMDKSK